MPTPHTFIYIEVFSRVAEQAVELTRDEFMSIPTNYCSCHEIVRRILEIRYTPGTATLTKEQVINVHLQAYKRQHGLIRYEVLPNYAQGI